MITIHIRGHIRPLVLVMEYKNPPIKVVLIGKQGVGKTTLAMRYVYNRFDPHSESTVGVAFMSKVLRVNGKPIVLNIWDTAGSERFNSFVTMYVRGAKFILVCFDSIEAELDSQSVIEEIKRYVDTSKHIVGGQMLGDILLVGTKADHGFDDGVVIRGKQKIEMYAKENKYKVFYTSSISGVGVESIFEYIASKCVDMDMTEVEQNRVDLTATSTNASTNTCCTSLPFMW